MTIFREWKKAGTVFLLSAATVIASPAQTFKTLKSFDGTDGNLVNAGLVQGFGGALYGTTKDGGVNDDGTVFKITPRGRLTTLHTFDGSDGANPVAALVQGTAGNFYGATGPVGFTGDGTVFKITPGGTLTTLHTFDGTHGADPNGLVQGTHGNFYGTTIAGGAHPDYGTVFKMTSGGIVTTLHSFDGSDGASPQAGLVQGTDGNFYGTTSSGGANNTCPNGCGTVFRITPEGKLTTLHSFDGSDGNGPQAGLVQGSDGDFYGTTYSGGANNSCSGACGTVFKITRRGKVTTLHTFDGTDGANPSAGLVQGTDGNFYGTAAFGGANLYYGTVFKITPGGTLTTLHSFAGYPVDGWAPYSGLVQATNGTFYGTTQIGGTSSNCGPYGCGTVYSLSIGLARVVETLPVRQGGNEGHHPGN
jgi:uncharacterized repeat protein (TIGR03803 family)